MYTPVNWVIIGSGSGLSPVRRQAITWTNAALLIELWEQISVNSNLNSTISIQENSFESVVCQNDSHFVQGEMS